jgi:hypothetical protein
MRVIDLGMGSGLLKAAAGRLPSEDVVAKRQMIYAFWHDAEPIANG